MPHYYIYLYFCLLTLQLVSVCFSEVFLFYIVCPIMSALMKPFYRAFNIPNDTVTVDIYYAALKTFLKPGDPITSLVLHSVCSLFCISVVF